ncbi:hypothetical protein QFC22_004613 [Naganishia vaughanmartiniae]|uniref:Uncharacterized protein n=1 Tax=Naganishia vaughanmartiniae TaxID=1424756 RepID=A0ACC2X0M9_9TREE|nr:hypothetical protein QFC22_004613 [Naganishia vaughanmartiniae]
MWPFSSNQLDSTPTPVSASAPSADKCPVDHSTRAAWLQANPGSSPFQPGSDNNMPPKSDRPSTSTPTQTFVKTASSTTQDSASASSSTRPSPSLASNESYLSSLMSRLSNQREVSSIPRHESTTVPTFSPNGEQTVTSSSNTTTPNPGSEPTTTCPNATDNGETNWVYPSEQQFFLAMMRKHSAKVYSPDLPAPNPEDMKTIVPIHNAVNERAWHQLMEWERGQGGDKCGGVRLVSFKGRPKDRTPKAWINMALGYTAPFDRHDWVINRCGQEVRYVIDFYSGRASPTSSSATGKTSSGGGLPPKDAGNLSFYLDVRPAVDGWEGVRLRASKLFGA